MRKIKISELREIIEQSHMAGQHNQGVDPSAYEATVYAIESITKIKELQNIEIPDHILEDMFWYIDMMESGKGARTGLHIDRLELKNYIRGRFKHTIRVV